MGRRGDRSPALCSLGDETAVIEHLTRAQERCGYPGLADVESRQKRRPGCGMPGKPSGPGLQYPTVGANVERLHEFGEGEQRSGATDVDVARRHRRA